ncbi:hypothetical protein MTO96_034292 [Rhipicephalus appendiculatus]
MVAVPAAALPIDVMGRCVLRQVQRALDEGSYGVVQAPPVCLRQDAAPHGKVQRRVYECLDGVQPLPRRQHRRKDGAGLIDGVVDDRGSTGWEAEAHRATQEPLWLVVEERLNLDARDSEGGGPHAHGGRSGHVKRRALGRIK